MTLNTYQLLHSSILGWLARPGDPLVEPAVNDFIRLFEAEAGRRLKHAYAEKTVTLTVTAAVNGVNLPADCVAVREVRIDGRRLMYRPPQSMPGTTGAPPGVYTVVGRQLILAPIPDTGYGLRLTYQSGVPPLSDTTTTNWLLTEAPDAYLFGSLVEAEAYIGHDERAAGWLQRREAAFESLRQADNKLRWPGGLQITVDGISSSAGGGGGASVAGTPPPEEARGPVIVVSPFDSTTVAMEDDWRSLYVATAPAALTIVLPRNETMSPGETVQVNFAAPVADFKFLQILEGAIGASGLAGTPTTAYGPGAAIQMRWVGTDGVGWLLWK